VPGGPKDIWKPSIGVDIIPNGRIYKTRNLFRGSLGQTWVADKISKGNFLLQVSLVDQSLPGIFGTHGDPIKVRQELGADF